MIIARTSLIGFAVFAWILVVKGGISANAVSVHVTSVRSTTDPFRAGTVDPVTGTYYERRGYQGDFHSASFDGPNVLVYNNQTDFEAGNVASTITLGGGEGFWGTYFTANDGQLFGRAGLVKTGPFSLPADTSVRRWNATTGAVETTLNNIPNMGSVNGTHTFHWGGYSGVNWMQDSTGLYVLGKNLTGNDWQLNKMDSDLNVLQTQTFTPSIAGNYGYGFMIDGNLLLGSATNSGDIVDVLNFSTGALTQESLTLTGQTANFWSNTFYDPNADTLYLYSTDARDWYKVEDAANAFGVGGAPRTHHQPRRWQHG